MELRVKVVPGASRDQIAGILGDRLKIRTATAPEAGRANKSVTALLADWLGIPSRRIELLSGQSNPEKTFLASGIDRVPQS
jgi:hypothetical protein